MQLFNLGLNFYASQCQLGAQLPLNINLKLGKAEHQPQDLPPAILGVLHASQEQPEEQEAWSGLARNLRMPHKSEPGLSQIT